MFRSHAPRGQGGASPHLLGEPEGRAAPGTLQADSQLSFRRDHRPRGGKAELSGGGDPGGPREGRWLHLPAPNVWAGGRLRLKPAGPGLPCPAAPQSSPPAPAWVWFSSQLDLLPPSLLFIILLLSGCVKPPNSREASRDTWPFPPLSPHVPLVLSPASNEQVPLSWPQGARRTWEIPGAHSPAVALRKSPSTGSPTEQGGVQAWLRAHRPQPLTLKPRVPHSPCTRTAGLLHLHGF